MQKNSLNIGVGVKYTNRMEGKKDYTPDIIFLLAGMFLLSVILARLQEYLSYWGLNTADFWDALKEFLALHVWPFVKLSGLVLGIGAVIGTIDALRKLRRVNLEERELFGLAHSSIPITENYAEEKNERWEHVTKLANSNNSSDWRLAILEADVMLDEMLRKASYHGDSVGEMLKSVERSDFLTLEDAWEAHKVRNRVAHDGATYQLNEREVKRVIALFENVFKEFQII